MECKVFLGGTILPYKNILICKIIGIQNFLGPRPITAIHLLEQNKNEATLPFNINVCSSFDCKLQVCTKGKASDHHWNDNG